MLFPFTETYRVVAPSFSHLLVPPPVQRRIDAVADDLPSTPSLFGFESWLGATTERVDFGMGIGAGDGSREAIREDRSRWSGELAAVCDAWAESPLLRTQVPAVFLEFDLDEAEGFSMPSVCVSLRGETGLDWRTELGRARRAAEEILPVLDGRPLPSRQRHAVDTAFEALRCGGCLAAVGVMLGRPDRPLRIHGWVPRRQLDRFLDGLGWTARRSEVERMAKLLSSPATPFVELSLDVLADGLSSRFGVEVAPGRADRPDRPEILARLLDRLCAAELCTSDRHRALREWERVDRVVLPGFDWPCTVEREVSHLKVVAHPSGPLQAKAYLTVRPTFQLFADVDRASAPASR